jgi:ribosomal protein L3 glutamine methyltransferase
MWIEPMAALPPECRHEPTLALDGGADGIAVIARIIAQAVHHLTDHGGLLCEVGRGRSAIEARYPELPFMGSSVESVGNVWLR